MATQKFEFPDLDLDIEVEVLSSVYRFFNHNANKPFGSTAVSTGIIGEGVPKALESPTMPFKKRKALDEAIRRVYLILGYKTFAFQRKKPNGKIVTKRGTLSK